jgi:hypothetical protein
MGKGKEKKRIAGSTAAGASSSLNGLTFAAFANHSSTAATAVSLANTPNTSTKGAKGNGGRKAHSLKPTPIYSGQDPKLLQIFKRIGQKRDAITKSRALIELSSYAYSKGPNTDANANDALLPKSEQVASLAHLCFLFGTKLITDNHTFVRAEALSCLASAISQVPKAARTLLVGSEEEKDQLLTTTAPTLGNIVGWVYTSQGESSNEVSKCAKRAWGEIVALYEHEPINDTTSQEHWTWNMERGGESNCLWKRIVIHVETILLASSRPSNLQEALSVIYKGGSNENRSTEKAKGKKSKKISTREDVVVDSKSSTISDAEWEEMEERHDRIVRLTIYGFHLLVTNYAETDFVYFHSFGKVTVLWKHISSAKGGFRRATYALVGALCENAPSLIHPRYYAKEVDEKAKGNDNLSSLLLNALSSERDPANFPLLFEMILLFSASFKTSSNHDNYKWNTTSESSVAWCRGMDLEAFTKAIGKVIKRGCYGSSSKDWCNSMLPILASLPMSDDQMQMSFLSNLVSQ